MNENPVCQSCRFWDPKWKFKKERRYDPSADRPAS